MDYVTQTVRLSNAHKTKMHSAYNKNKGITIQLSKNELTGSDQILLTRSQLNKLNEAKRLKKGIRINFSKTQLSQSGGFLPFLATLAALAAPALLGLGKAAALGSAGEIGKNIWNKITGRGVAKKKFEEEACIYRERANKYRNKSCSKIYP